MGGSRSEDVHIVWAISSVFICHFFHKINIVIFVAKMKRCICHRHQIGAFLVRFESCSKYLRFSCALYEGPFYT